MQTRKLISGLRNAREQAKSSFFAIMRPRFIRAQNLIKYASGKRLQLDRDLLALQRALNNRVPEWGVEEDWRLPLILEQNFPKLSAESTDASQRII